ncbi:MAG: hypothetical protein GWP60_08975 [Gammaproteobacteria bacterium]|jgi:hypothetical protein|nr:hypothetical protein [Gammaproteobacteria bacterium]
MGTSSIAAVAAVFLAVVMIALCSAAESPMNTLQTEQRLEAVDIHGLQARHTLRGQAWAAELFGRRYGRNLLA